jgi:hypothetical protein
LRPDSGKEHALTQASFATAADGTRLHYRTAGQASTRERFRRRAEVAERAERTNQLLLRFLDRLPA